MTRSMARLSRRASLLALLALAASACSPLGKALSANPEGTAIGSPESPAKASASSSRPTTELTVFAAASLTEAFQEIARDFEAANPGAKGTFNFGGSNDLAAAIVNAAPADVFASANQTQMDLVVKAGRIDPELAHPFARNRLIVIVPKDNPAHVARLQDLAKPGLKLVLAAKEVPVGQYARDFLGKAGRDRAFGPDYPAAVLANVVSNEQDVKAVLNKVALGEADAGIVYTTDVTPGAAGKVGRLDIPDALNSIATYPIAPLRAAPNPDLARKFVDYVLAPPGQVVIARYGFIPVDQTVAGDASSEASLRSGHAPDQPRTLGREAVEMTAR